MADGGSYTLRLKREPPAAPSPSLARPALRRMLDEAAARRVVTVLAGPGYGKTTLVAQWARQRKAAWYAADLRDGDLLTFAAGLLDAMRDRYPVGARPVLEPLGPQADHRSTVDAMAASLAEVFERFLPDDAVLVVDDCDALPLGSPGAALLRSLCHQSPRVLHLVLVGRQEPPLALHGLRGRDLVADIDASQLAFTLVETRALLAEVLGSGSGVLATSAYRLTRGWPVAVRMLAVALDRVPPAERLHRMTALYRPGGVLGEYLAEEVVAAGGPVLRTLWPLTAGVPRFTADMCRAGGLDVDDGTLCDLARRGLLVQVEHGAEPVFAVPPLVAAVVRELPPPTPDRHRAVLDAAVAWFVARRRHGEALQVVREAGDPAALVAHLHRHGDTLLTAGEVAAVADAVSSVPQALRTPTLFRMRGQSRQVRGDWSGALADLHRAAGDSEAMPAGLAWRIGLIHYLRGELDDAVTVLRRGMQDPQPAGGDHARVLGWAATVYWLRQERARCLETATAALTVAEASGDDGALAVAHTARALLAAMDGDQSGNAMHYRYAERAAERAGDLLALIRVRNNLGSRSLEEGRHRTAVLQFAHVIRLAERTGYAALLALAVHNRGLAYLGLGRLPEAAADFGTAVDRYRDLGSRMVAYPLMRLADVHRLRGELRQARTMYEQAVAEAQAAGDVQGSVPALAGLARVLVDDDPDRARTLVGAALACGPGLSEAEALLAAGWVALARGERSAAAQWARRAVTAAQSRHHRPRLAEAIEMTALAEDRPERVEIRLAEAAELWTVTEQRLGLAVNDYLRARLSGRPSGEAEHRLRTMGVSPDGGRHGAGALRWLAGADAPPSVRVLTLGAFVLLRNGVAVTAEEWRSRKARDLLKLLVTQHGRMVARETAAEALWPDEEPARLANRLSVALSTLRSILDPGRRFPSDHFVRADKFSMGLGTLDVDVLTFLRTARDGLARLAHTSAGTPAGEPTWTLLATAAADYTGDFLQDDPYLEWAAPMREAVRARYLQVLRALARLAVDEGHVDEAVQYLLRLLERDPYDEATHLRLVRVLRAAGRHGEARRCYHRYCERMAELEVEIAPFPDEPPLPRSRADGRRVASWHSDHESVS